MKIRTGFVSNSSSSSFVVSRSVLSEKEIRKIMSYSNLAESKKSKPWWKDYSDWWEIIDDEALGVIRGRTSMDNGDLYKYLGKKLGDKCIFEE